MAQLRRRIAPVSRQMTADEYLMGHWREKRIWEHNSTRPHHLRRFAFIAKNLEGQRFLDCGCAFGHSTAQLENMYPGSWEGADFSEAGIAEARRTFPAIPFHYAADWSALPTLGRFDSIVLSEVLEHVPDDRGLVTTLMTMTPRLIVTTPCRNVGDPGHVRLYTRETLAQLFDGYTHTLDQDDTFFLTVVTHHE